MEKFPCYANTFLWVVFTFLIAIMIAWIVVYFSLPNFNPFSDYDQVEQQYCESLLPFTTYVGQTYIPEYNGVYELDLAKNLLSVSFASSQANCANVAVTNPPGFNQKLRLEGPDPNDTTQTSLYGYIFWNVETGYAIISFSGTITRSQWISDFNFPLTPATKLNNYVPGVQCHEGFYKIYTSAQPLIWEWWRQYSTSISSIFITGHSLGGAISTICAYDLANIFGASTSDDPVYPIHYSFAAPRSFNVIGANNFAKIIPTSLRINNTEDIVPTLPPATWDNYTYEQTIGSIPFTKSLGSLIKDHVEAYAKYLPECPVVAPCLTDE